MRSILIALMLIPPGVLIFSMLLLRLQLQRFQRRIPTVRTQDDLISLERLAKVQMYVALLAPLIWAPGVIWAFGIFIMGVLGWWDLLLYVVLPFLLLGVAAHILGEPAKEVQAISVTDPALQARRDHIIDVWLHRKLPDW